MNTLKQVLQLAGLSALIAQAHCQVGLSNGLVAYYKLDGDAKDSSGNAHDAQNAGAVFVADRFNSSNRAARYDGVSGHTMSVPNSIGLLTPVAPLSASMWVRIDANPVGLNSAIFEAWGVFDILSTGISGANQVICQIHNDNGLHRRWLLNKDPSPALFHLLFSWDGAEGVVYVDGIPRNTTKDAEAVIIPSRNWVIGGFNFNGVLDDVRIYNRALSSNEVAQLYAHESFCSPHPAQATAALTAGFVTGATILDNGCGYDTPPSVRIVGGGGTGATAVALVADGLVTNVIITSAGSGYASPPRILIESPPFVPQVVKISVSKVNVSQKTRINHNYILEISQDLATWEAAGPQFTAEAELITTEHDVSAGERYFFRLREVP